MVEETATKIRKESKKSKSFFIFFMQKILTLF